MKKTVSLLLVLVLCVLMLPSCAQKGENEEPTASEGGYVLPTPVVRSDISLPYTSADVLSPYKSESEFNRDLLCTVFEGLFYPSQDGKGVPVLASSYENSGKTVTVKLGQGIRFSDGGELTAPTVKSSFDKAKNSGWYSRSLSGIESAVAVDNYTVRFALSYPDDMVANVLDFPIVKEKGTALYGTGSYKFAVLDGEPYLEINKYNRDYKETDNPQIALYDMSGTSSPVYPFKANKISVYINDLSDGAYNNLSSQTVSVPTNNLVYIGLNSSWQGSLTSIDWVRHAINIGINRNLIASSSFLGQTNPVVTPFKSEFYKLGGMELAELSGEVQRAVGILESHGYDTENAEGIRSNGNTLLKVSILVCSDNAYKVGVAENLAASLKTLGFGVNIMEKNAEGFKDALEEGHFDMYIGEIELTANCSLDPFFKNGGHASFGIDEEFFASYRSYMLGETGVSQFIESFYLQVPFVPLFYRNAVVSVNPNISGCSAAGQTPLYAGVSGWQFAG